MENFVKRLEEVRRNIKIGGYFEKAGTLDGGEKGSYNPTIPEGFKPVDTETSKWGDGTKAPEKKDVDNGLVIEDKEGNQFVWVPCSTTGKDPATEAAVTKYANHQYTGEDANDGGKNQTDSEGWKTWSYRVYNDWSDPAATSYGNTSVNTYGGFYVARYEAGIPETADFYPDAENGFEYKPQYKNGAYVTVSEKDIRDRGDITPVSKKNTPSWSHISQGNADKAAKLMVPEKSYLIDGTAWDTIVNWINDKTKTMNDSSNVGNYRSSISNIPTGIMYIQHKYDNNWITGDNYVQTTAQLSEEETARYEVYTGSLDNTKLKNIYDMAGNMWEWTTETGKYDNGSTTFAVRRGGSFISYGTENPLCNRIGTYSAAYHFTEVGFRVVLYL